MNNKKNKIYILKEGDKSYYINRWR